MNRNPSLSDGNYAQKFSNVIDGFMKRFYEENLNADISYTSQSDLDKKTGLTGVFGLTEDAGNGNAKISLTEKLYNNTIGKIINRPILIHEQYEAIVPDGMFGDWDKRHELVNYLTFKTLKDIGTPIEKIGYLAYSRLNAMRGVKLESTMEKYYTPLKEFTIDKAKTFVNYVKEKLGASDKEVYDIMPEFA